MTPGQLEGDHLRMFHEYTNTMFDQVSFVYLWGLSVRPIRVVLFVDGLDSEPPSTNVSRIHGFCL